MSACDARTSRSTTSPDVVPAEAGTNARPATSRRPPRAAMAPRVGSEARRMATSVTSGDRTDRLPVRFAVTVPDPSRRDAHRGAEAGRNLRHPTLGARVVSRRDVVDPAVAAVDFHHRADDRRCARPRPERAGRADEVEVRVVPVEAETGPGGGGARVAD